MKDWEMKFVMNHGIMNMKHNVLVVNTLLDKYD